MKKKKSFRIWEAMMHTGTHIAPLNFEDLKFMQKTLCLRWNLMQEYNIDIFPIFYVDFFQSVPLQILNQSTCSSDNFYSFYRRIFSLIFYRPLRTIDLLRMERSEPTKSVFEFLQDHWVHIWRCQIFIPFIIIFFKFLARFSIRNNYNHFSLLP